MITFVKTLIVVGLIIVMQIYLSKISSKRKGHSKLSVIPKEMSLVVSLIAGLICTIMLFGVS